MNYIDLSDEKPKHLKEWGEEGQRLAGDAEHWFTAGLHESESLYMVAVIVKAADGEYYAHGVSKTSDGSYVGHADKDIVQQAADHLNEKYGLTKTQLKGRIPVAGRH